MLLGICGGLMFGGMMVGAITGSVELLLIYAGAGAALAGVAELARAAKEREAARRKLNVYPAYRY